MCVEWGPRTGRIYVCGIALGLEGYICGMALRMEGLDEICLNSHSSIDHQGVNRLIPYKLNKWH